MSKRAEPVQDLERTRLKVRCAQLYWGLVPGLGEDLRQSDVARRLGVPRSQVVVWLKEARTELLEIRLLAPRALALELPLLERLRPYGVREVRVVVDGGLSPWGALEAVGAEAGRWLRSALAPGLSVGLSGGRTLQAAVREAVRGGPLPRLALYPLAAGGSLPVSANALTAMLAAAAARGTRAHGLWVPPLRPESREDLRGFLRRREVRSVYREAQRVDLCLLGIGAVRGPEAASRMGEYLGVSRAAARSMARTAARGFVLQQFIDGRGRDFPCSLGERNLAVPLSAVRRMARCHPRRAVLLAAAGAEKAEAVAAAVRGRLLSVLVADTPVAESLWEEFRP